MKISILSIAFFALVFSSCGPSKAELEAKEIILKDSLKNVAIQDSIANANNEAMKQQLIDLKGQLAGEQSKLDQMQDEKTGFFAGRTEDEKAQQIADQTKVVEQIKSQISDLEKQIK